MKILLISYGLPFVALIGFFWVLFTSPISKDVKVTYGAVVASGAILSTILSYFGI